MFKNLDNYPAMEPNGSLFIELIVNDLVKSASCATWAYSATIVTRTARSLQGLHCTVDVSTSLCRCVYYLLIRLAATSSFKSSTWLCPRVPRVI
ncbi:BQ5605_C047g12332 [Microbotryum silenes-dioicae]|uniref:BQ5605_C047g12332 protein n=1 Tax=Microbotryum silenes-dioicae TaxID=796604 RepID=A0A2X0MTE9_9BASI|nr:BQ5605_C047g12332 [Microbotryum silenes-dioicae]